MVVHSFREKLAKGQDYESIMDGHFSRQYRVMPVSRFMQQHGVDRIFRRIDGAEFTVEYKADERAHQTGNVFIELTSVVEKGIPGWAESSWAQVLVYYLPGSFIAYLVDMSVLKRILFEWRGRYARASAKNNGYTTDGLLVPVAEFVNRVVFAEEPILPL